MALWGRRCGVSESLLLCLLLLVPGPGPESWSGHAARADDTALSGSRFDRTASYLQAAPQQLRVEFSLVALDHLAEALSHEIALAAEERAGAAQQRKLRGWALAVDAYLGEVESLQQAIAREGDASLFQTHSGELEIRGYSRAVILSHPRPDQQAVMEQAILSQFCLGRNCQVYTAQPEEGAREPIPLSRGSVRPRWHFSGDTVECASHGLSVRFSDVAQLPRHRLLCQQFLQEALSLSDGIAWQQRHSVVPDWSVLAVSALPGRPEHRVTLNRQGDTFTASLPVIAGTPGLLPALSPWLRGRLEEASAEPLALEARQLGWQ